MFDMTRISNQSTPLYSVIPKQNVLVISLDAERPSDLRGDPVSSPKELAEYHPTRFRDGSGRYLRP